MPCTSCNGQLDDVCRQTDRPGHSCLQVWKCSVCSEVHERLLCCLAFVNVAQDMETDRKSCELSWAHEHKPECERCSIVVCRVTWCSFIHPSKPGSFTAKHLHKLCTGLKIKLALLEKYCSPARPLPTVIINRLGLKTWKDLAFRL